MPAGSDSCRLLLSGKNFRAKDGGIVASCLPEELVDEHGKLCLPRQGSSLPQGWLQFTGAQEVIASGWMGQHCPQAPL